MRDRVFLKDQEPTVEDLVDTFRGEFDFPQSDEGDFIKLFDGTEPEHSVAERWFELAPPEVLEVLLG